MYIVVYFFSFVSSNNITYINMLVQKHPHRISPWQNKIYHGECIVSQYSYHGALSISQNLIVTEWMFFVLSISCLPWQYSRREWIWKSDRFWIFQCNNVFFLRMSRKEMFPDLVQFFSLRIKWKKHERKTSKSLAIMEQLQTGTVTF